MLKKFLVMFGMVAAFVGNVGAEAVTPKQETTGDKCYLIGTADELEGFAGIVNGSATAFKGCAKLTADIHYLGNAQLLNDAGDGLACGNNCGSDKSWTPLKNFAGTFDGQDHTIYGLYAAESSPAFIRNTKDSATVKNLKIADTYFYSTDGNPCSGNGNNAECVGVAGGFVGYVEKSARLLMESCGFSGAVSGVEATNKRNGGLIGTLGGSSKLYLKNSYNEGFVNGGGLIGATVMKADLDANNCYNIGTTVFPLLGQKYGNGGNVVATGSNLGCNASSAEDCSVNFTLSSNVAYVSSDPASIVANYWANIYGKIPEDPGSGEGGGDSGEDPVNPLEAAKQHLQAQIDALKEKGMKGIDFDFKEIKTCHLEGTENVCNTSVVLVAVLKLELTDTVSTLNMPENFPVYGVEYNRVFSKNSSECANASTSTDPTTLPFSTTVLPFTKDVKDIQGAKFFEPVELAPNGNDKYWHIGVVEKTGNIEAHKPYLVCPTAEKLTFNGSTTVMQTKGDGIAEITEFERKPTDPAGLWQFVGLYRKRTFGPDSSDNGRAYGFSGGSFYNIGEGSKSPILRAFILAPAKSDPSTAKKMAPLPGVQRIASSEGVSVDEFRPAQLLLKILGDDADEINWVPVDYSLVPPDSTEGDLTGFQKPMIFPAKKNSEAPWFDMKGRRMNRKPSTKGAYFNNGVSTIIK